MDNEKKTNPSTEEVKLDDAKRVQVLSPGMMVAKRFFRNKLAIVGLVIIVCMFLFAFVAVRSCHIARAKSFTVWMR